MLEKVQNKATSWVGAILGCGVLLGPVLGFDFGQDDADAITANVAAVIGAIGVALASIGSSVADTKERLPGKK